MKRDRIHTFAGAVALIVLALIIYGSTLGSVFVYDDTFQIVRNPWIRSYTFLDDIFTSHSFAFSKEGYQAVSYRPFVFLVFMVEHAIFGLEPWGWHFISVLLHAANAVMLFVLIKRLLPSEMKGVYSAIAAFAPSALFLTLPVNSESASWVGCVPELVYTLFLLGAFYCYLLSRERGAAYVILAVALYALAMLTKETAIIFPAFIFLYEVAGRTERLISARMLKKYIPYMAAAFAFLAIRFYAIGNVTPSEKISASLTGFQYFINAFPLFIKYMRSLVLPVGNHPLQLFDPVLSLAEPRAFLSVLAVLLIAAVLFALRKRIKPVHALALALIMLPLLPVFYVPTVSRTPFADRYLYLPSAGLALGLSVLFFKSGQGRFRIALAGIFAMVVIANSVWAAKRSAVWKDERSLWTEAAAGASGNYMAVHSLGLLDLREGKTDEGIEKLKAALKGNLESREPDTTVLVLTHKVLGMAYHKKGLLDEAVREYNAVLKLSPEDRVANFNLGAAAQESGFYSDAVEHYKTALIFTQESAQRKDILRNLGSAYHSLGLKNEALASYNEALALAPGDADILSAVQKAREGR